MVKIAWCTDLHLDSTNAATAMYFIDELCGQDADAIVITGDIAEAKTFAGWLKKIDEKAKVPVCFVLGNHDFWCSKGAFRTMDDIMDEASSLGERADSHLVYLTSHNKPVLLDGETLLLGHDSWYDGRYANPFKSLVELNDFTLNKSFLHQPMGVIVERCRAMADSAASYLEDRILRGLADYEEIQTVILAMHVSPFRETATYRGKVSDDDWAPWFTCQAVGDMLLGLAWKFRDVYFHVLCGHSHGGADVSIRDNLRVTCGEARYGRPRVQPILTIDKWVK